MIVYPVWDYKQGPLLIARLPEVVQCKIDSVDQRCVSPGRDGLYSGFQKFGIIRYAGLNFGAGRNRQQEEIIVGIRSFQKCLHHTLGLAQQCFHAAAGIENDADRTRRVLCVEGNDLLLPLVVPNGESISGQSRDARPFGVDHRNRN